MWQAWVSEFHFSELPANGTNQIRLSAARMAYHLLENMLDHLDKQEASRCEGGSQAGIRKGCQNLSLQLFHQAAHPPSIPPLNAANKSSSGK